MNSPVYLRMQAPLLQIKNLCVDFVNNQTVNKALKNVSISVNPGELLAIVGESGSGKSVCSLSILQLIPSPPAIYRSGEIIFQSSKGEIDLIRASSQELHQIRGNQIAMIFQEPMTSLNPVFTCGNQVMEAILQHKPISRLLARQQTIELFQQVKLPDPEKIFERYPHQLSGGQKQRIMIAMAMSCNPSLLICDEPTTALDVTVQKNILELIRDLQTAHQMAVLFITHDLSVVSEIADRVAVMFKGEIVEQDKAEKIFRTPRHPYTRALLACRPQLHLKGSRLPVVSDFMEITEDGLIKEKNSFPYSGFLTEESKQETVTSNREAFLAVRNLTVQFPLNKNFFGRISGYNKAVDDVSFELYQGETLGLVGESGCGKSSLGRAILRLIEPSHGKIMYKGNDLLNAGGTQLKALKKEMQIIFQDPYSSLNPRITVGEAIAEPLEVHGIIKGKKKQKERVIDLLNKVNLLPEHYDRYPHEFSGGQRQRVVIARALALRPSFIICDESVSALDVSVQAQVLNLLNSLKKEFGFTAIFISHDLSVVRYISDRIMVMNKGKIVETGTVEQVVNSPQNAYTQQLISSIPKIAY
jgi:peptide/nickel transport system ATP-binding protein